MVMDSNRAYRRVYGRAPRSQARPTIFHTYSQMRGENLMVNVREALILRFVAMFGIEAERFNFLLCM